MKVRLKQSMLLLLFIALSGVAQGNEGIVIKRRMSERLPVIEALKLSGDIGENAHGYLEARTDLSEKHRKLISDENEDRKKIYIILGIKIDKPPEYVALHRAEQIAERSIKGVWLQEKGVKKKEGTWYRK